MAGEAASFILLPPCSSSGVNSVTLIVDMLSLYRASTHYIHTQALHERAYSLLPNRAPGVYRYKGVNRSAGAFTYLVFTHVKHAAFVGIRSGSRL